MPPKNQTPKTTAPTGETYDELRAQLNRVIKTHCDITTLNHNLTQQINTLQDKMKKAETDNWSRIADLHTQLHSLNQQLLDQHNAWKTHHDTLQKHYQDRKNFWTKQHEDDQATIKTLTEAHAEQHQYWHEKNDKNLETINHLTSIIDANLFTDIKRTRKA